MSRPRLQRASERVDPRLWPVGSVVGQIDENTWVLAVDETGRTIRYRYGEELARSEYPELYTAIVAAFPEQATTEATFHLPLWRSWAGHE